MSEEVIIIGASGHGRVIADMLKKTGMKIYGYLDDDDSVEYRLGRVSDCIYYKDKSFVIAIGNNTVRKSISQKYPELDYATIIHPSAIIGEDVSIGKGTVIMANAVINPGVKIGQHCIINTASIIEHDNVLKDYVHISPNATLCGTVHVGELTHIGACAVVRNNITIGDNIKIGCGACVVNDIVKKGTYAGVPAKEIVK